MKILFISTLNLATNPRFYKEIMLAKKTGHEIEVVCFEFNNWSYHFNKELLESLANCNVHLIPGNRKPFFQWAGSVFKEQLYRWIGRYTRLKGKILSQAVTRRSDLLIKYINRSEGAFDLVIGHNPGSLFPVFYASQKFHCRCGFDVEDYHPGEGDNKLVKRLTKHLMNQFLPKMNYVTFAAPLMKEKHIEDCGKEGENWQVILNLFPKNQFVFTERKRDEPLQIVWFSQNVNYKRGLEQWIPALKFFENEIELTLIGNRKEPFYSEYVKGNLFVKSPGWMNLEELIKKICSCDIGLALEIGKDENNFLAISNKMIAYYQAGLYILATDTPGQKEFMKSHPHNGMILSTAQEGFMEKLAQVIASKESIRRTKRERFQNACTFNWETESEKLLKLWEERPLGFEDGAGQWSGH